MPRPGSLFRRLLGYAGLALLAIALFALVDAWSALGTRANGPRRARMESSPNWRGGQFVNPQPIINDLSRTLGSIFRTSPYLTPSHPVPVVKPEPKVFATPPGSGLRVTWFGHSSSLIEIDGRRVLTDPLFGERISPLGWTGPERWYPPPIALADLPPIDVVVVSHDHYDHLDRGTIVAMRDWPTTFVVPLGLGADLAYWGIPESRIVELDWWDRTRVGDLEIVLTPTRHASGRHVFDRDAKLWGGFAFLGPAHRVYYSGDSGLFPALREVGEKLGPFDLAMIEVGQYDAGWPDWHMGPEQAVVAAGLVRGRLFLPVHWGALALAAHGWTEPVERALVAAQAAGLPIVTPKPGESIDPTAPPPPERWWPSLPWRTAAQDPIVSSQMQ